MNDYKRKKKKKYNSVDLKNRVISKQTEEIKALENKVKDLKIDAQNKEEIISSIEKIKEELDFVINEVKAKSKKYDELIKELRQMKSVMNQTVFKGRWKIIKWLIK